MKLLATVRRDLADDRILPNWEKNVPHCAEDACPRFDGKRCDAMGFRPDGICEPAVQRMGDLLNSANYEAST